MKRRDLLTGLLAGVLALSLAACGPGEPEPTGTPSPEPAPAATPSPTPEPEPSPTPAAQAPVWGEQVFARTFTAGDGTTVLDVSLTLPMVQNTDVCPAGAAVNDWYKAEGAARMLEAEDAYEMAVADYDVSKAAGFPFSPTVQEMDFRVTRSDGAVLSVRREFYVNYGGAAHPFVNLLSENFDAATGAKLGFADFFTDADAVQQRAVDAFVEQYGLEDSRDAVTVAWQAEHFYLSEEGYVFWISGGVLPGASSPLEVTLPYADMEDVSAHG